jgi:hypothetical protein
MENQLENGEVKRKSEWKLTKWYKRSVTVSGTESYLQE